MTSKFSPDSTAYDGKLERIAQLQQAIEQASHEVQVAQSLQPQEQQIMLRIMAQRRRVKQHEAQPKWSRANRVNGLSNGWSESESSSRSFTGNASSLMHAVPFAADAKAFALRHPVAVGLALGATMVIGPRRLFRTALWVTPFLWRSWDVAQRVNMNFRKRN